MPTALLGSMIILPDSSKPVTFILLAKPSSKVKIIGIDPVRGYAIEDEHGNKMYEIGWEI